MGEGMRCQGVLSEYKRVTEESENGQSGVRETDERVSSMPGGVVNGLWSLLSILELEHQTQELERRRDFAYQTNFERRRNIRAAKRTSSCVPADPVRSLQ